MTEANATVAEFVKAVSNAIERRLLDVHTSLPGVVDSFDPVTKTADIQVALKRELTDGTEIQIPKLTNVPIMWPRTTSGGIYFPLAKGDYVTLFFIERSTDAWRVRGGVVNPKDSRKFHLSDAFAYPGGYPDIAPMSVPILDIGNFVIMNGDAMVSLADDGTVKAGTTTGVHTEPAILGNVLKDYLDTVNEKLDAIIDIMIAGTSGLTTGPGNSTAPNPATAAAFTTHKAELLAAKVLALDTAATNILSETLFTQKGGV